jgi:hypothetical protein
MRDYHFLRTPIRGDHQSRLTDVQVSEAALAGDPALDAVYPQTLEISFGLEPAVTEVQIAPVWEGALIFLPDATTGNPVDPVDVTPAAYPGWSVTGDIVLRTLPNSANSAVAFERNVPLVGRPPATVRYSSVRLTEDFLFTTLAQAAPTSLVFNGQFVDADDPEFHEKLVIAFLAGSAAVACLQDPDDSGQDLALAPMPAVALASFGPTVLRVAAATLSEQVRDLAWFDQHPEYDDLPGELLVDPTLSTEQDLLYNPAHPSHSVISLWGLFQSAKLVAFAPDTAIGLPVRIALTAPRPDGLSYRRLDLFRPPIPGAPVSSAPQRPFPQYRLSWAPSPDQSLRIPLSGEAYLPLEDGDYSFWAVPRSEDPAATLPSEQFRLSARPTPPAKAIGLPSDAVVVDLTGLDSASLYAHLEPYDAAYEWDGYSNVAARRGGLMAQAEADWNVTVLIWQILPTSASQSSTYAPVYGYIRESAGRHGLAPEFLQAVLFGEGVAQDLSDGIKAGVPFADNARVSAYGSLGLDLILYRTGRVPAGKPLIPPGISVEESAEYTFNLVDAGYVDPSTAAKVSFDVELPRKEGGRIVTLQLASITGWDAAVELVAAELHARLDDMLAYLAAKVPPVPVADERQRRYLAYVRFNASAATARAHADALSTRLQPWVGAPPANNRDARYNTLQRIATTQWHEAAGIYR